MLNKNTQIPSQFFQKWIFPSFGKDFSSTTIPMLRIAIRVKIPDFRVGMSEFIRIHGETGHSAQIPGFQGRDAKSHILGVGM